MDFDAAIAINGNDAIALTWRGATYASKGEYDRAVRDYDAAIGVDPKYEPAFAALAAMR